MLPSSALLHEGVLTAMGEKLTTEEILAKSDGHKHQKSAGLTET